MPGDRLLDLQGADGEILPFRTCIELELDLLRNHPEAIEPSLVRRGLYLQQLRAYWKAFQRDQVLVLGFSDLRLRPQFVLDEVCMFLGIEKHSWKDYSTVSNKGEYQEKISKSSHDYLSDFYRGPNEELFEEIGPINW